MKNPKVHSQISNFPPPVHVLNKMEASQSYSLEIHFNIIHGPEPCRLHTFQVQFPFLTSFKRINPSPRLCEIFSDAVSCRDVELLATRPTNKLEDTPFRMSTTAYSVYYQLPSLSGDHLLLRNLRVGHTVVTRKHLVWLMILSNYYDSLLC